MYRERTDMKRRDHSFHLLTFIIRILIITAGINLSFPAWAASAASPILRVGNDFSLSGPTILWKQASAMMLEEEMLLDEGKQASLKVYLLYNDTSLLWGFDIQGLGPDYPDDYSPDFSGSDHVKLQFILRVKSQDYPGSILILPDSIFQTPLVTPDYSYYQEHSGLPGYGIGAASIKEGEGVFIMLAIPYTALGSGIPAAGDSIDFKIGFVLAGSGQENWTLWVPTPGDSREYDTAQFE